MTLKNYKRPNGVATQIFNVKLIGYEATGDDLKLLTANSLSSNQFTLNNRLADRAESTENQSSVLDSPTRRSDPANFNSAQVKES